MPKKNDIEGKVLGRKVDYPSKYAPHLLVAVPRYLNRIQYNIHDHHLPFVGYDVWHAYELGFLTELGLPVIGVLKLVYPSDSHFLVESKSLKLYLNSFNMQRIGDSVKEGVEKILNIIKNDLCVLLNTDVDVSFFSEIKHFDLPFSDFSVLEEMNGAEAIQFCNFSDTPELLKIEHEGDYELKVATHLLRSNCKITHQPDWGSAFIKIRGHLKPNVLSLLEYIISFRNENHFHEEICEMLYKRLFDVYKPDELLVACIYTRRGGIDISPVRASDPDLLNISLCNASILTNKMLRQ
ncbi:MAG: NADPH-dependent 7-cyano-7-deazaguanine reductase QueF [Marinilabiliaceae bacterium]|nr:NADPH-dependent 7-cyano-7-deazaguanine reductase QueF [Marinilabiliaceae bacterium]